ncbi:MAG: hypothetical protein IJV17_03890 [Prevotella sp.]|nr:hypothetical protein [Prevotella sp.]
MKKILLAVMAVAAISFTSCGNKTQQGEATDSAVAEVNIADEEADAAIAALTANLEANDANKFQEVLTSVKDKVAELIKANPEAAKQYVERVQSFLKENADKVKAVIGDNAAAAALVSSVTEIEPASILNSITESATDAKDAAVDAVNEKVDEAKAAAENKANEVKDAAKQKANDAVDNAAANVKKGLGL